MHVLVLNCGSSSIKYEVRELAAAGVAAADAGAAVADGLVERVGEGGGGATHRVAPAGGTLAEAAAVTDSAPVADHDDGLRRVVAALEDGGLAARLDAVGHRVVHGGEAFTAPTVVDDAVVARLRELVPLAPLHNPANLAGIEVARALRGDLAHVAVFDTAFHRTLPPAAHRYAVPAAWYDDHDVRRYGFHGTSHAWVARQAAAWLGREPGATDVITLHLGNGASACAVRRGASVDTSMGLSPLEGLVMGTRSGDVDPAAVFHVARRQGVDVASLERVLNRESGLVGLCGDNDVREILARADAGDGDARLALDVYTHRLRTYIGAYLAVLGGADALVFTAGVGENAPAVRARACHGLGALGIELDEAANAAVAGPAAPTPVHAAASATAVLVVPTDEEGEIARQTAAAVGG